MVWRRYSHNQYCDFIETSCKKRILNVHNKITFIGKETAANFARLERYCASPQRTYHRAAGKLRATQREKLRIEAKIRKVQEMAGLNAIRAVLEAPLPFEVPGYTADHPRQSAEAMPSRVRSPKGRERR